MLDIQDSEQRTVQELVRIVFARMCTRNNRRNISKKDVLKILFQAKKTLPDSNPIKNIVPYYWYKDGPYSTMIYEIMDNLQKDGMISLSGSEYKTYSYNRDKINIPLCSDEHLNEAKTAINSVINEFTHIGALVKVVYDDAPYSWYNTYNLKFKIRFNDFCNKATSASGNENGYTCNDILDILEDIVLDFPPFLDFQDLHQIFMKFSRLVNSFLQTDGYMEQKAVFPVLKDISNSIWDVFAHGVRIKFHDVYYDDRVDEWNTIYKKELAKLDKNIRLHQEEIDCVSTYEPSVAPYIVNMKCHPEKYGFEDLNLDHIIS